MKNLRYNNSRNNLIGRMGYLIEVSTKLLSIYDLMRK